MKLNNSLKMKFLVPTISLVIVGMVFSNIISYSKSKKALSDSLIELMNNTSEYTVKNLSNWLTDRQNDLKSWSSLEMVPNTVVTSEDMETARKKMSNYFSNLKAIYPYYENICIADSSGLVIAGAVPEQLERNINVTDRAYFKEGMKGNDFISEMIVSKATGNPIICFSKPLKYNSQVLGVIFAVVDLSSFSKEYIDSVKIGETGYGYIFDQDGRVIAHPDKKMILNVNAKDTDFGHRIMEMGTGFITYIFKGEEKQTSFRKIESTGWIVAVVGNSKEMLEPIVNLRTINTLISLIIVFLVAVTIYFITNSMVRPINEVVEGLKDAAEGDGDLTKRLAVKSQDEVGELARWFNTFIEKIQVIIYEVAKNASQLSASSRTLASISSEVSQGANQISSNASTVSAAGEEMSISMESIAHAIDQSTGNIHMVAVATEEMESTINDIAKNAETTRKTTNQAVSQAEKASDRMNELGSAAHEIEKVIEAITEISEQVNLLALNATIEAARAGEAGKGFAVVANEIKELAKQTSDATSDIKQRVSAIQNTTEATISEIGAISSVVNNVNEIVIAIASSIEEQALATKEISGNVAQASGGMNDVNLNVSQGSAVSKEIAKDMAQMTLAINEMAENSVKIRTNSEELSGMAETLNGMVSRFKV